ncbi:MAG: N-formylglutamate amidohydrolase [Caldilineaceae bacterium]|nr:N-formylglutamate amidohydrolase [Caldilineaceae bacterium]HRJ44231.1 N-formylglutamate amidohydrolase [Caldilineaceae bacterium]
MQTQLPVVQSLPHPGLAVPALVADRLAIDDVTIYNECDLWNDQIFDFAHPSLARPAQVLDVATMPIARVLIDANRPPDSLDNPDGAVKSHTSYGDPIYSTPLSPQEQVRLLDEEWGPFHSNLDRALTGHAADVRLFLDCHNMAQHGPSAYGDPGQVRPLICIANFGDAKGEAVTKNGALTAPPDFVRQAGAIAEKLFGDLVLLQPDPERPAPVVALNQPFVGGYILRRYCDRAYQQAIGSNYVGLMVEINRGLFVGDQNTRTPIQPPNLERIAAIRLRLLGWVEEILRLL